MLDPKRILLKYLSKQPGTPRKAGKPDPKLVLRQIRQAQQRQAGLDGAVIANPPFERRQA